MEEGKEEYEMDKMSDSDLENNSKHNFRDFKASFEEDDLSYPKEMIQDIINRGHTFSEYLFALFITLFFGDQSDINVLRKYLEVLKEDFPQWVINAEVLGGINKFLGRITDFECDIQDIDMKLALCLKFLIDDRIIQWRELVFKNYFDEGEYMEEMDITDSLYKTIVAFVSLIEDEEEARAFVESNSIKKQLCELQSKCLEEISQDSLPSAL